MTKYITKWFNNLSGYQKGYVVYMFGERDDFSNVPAQYEPSNTEKEEYERGQWEAYISVLDSES